MKRLIDHGEGDDVVIQLLCTNDTHSQMEPFEATRGSEKGRRVGGRGEASVNVCPDALRVP